MRKALLLTVLLTLVAMPAHACPWLLYGMFQDGTLPDGYWWKPVKQTKTSAECRAMVKAVTKRPVAGLISWYHFPPLPPEAPRGIRAVMAAKPAGGADPWVGCLPKDYDPAERRN